MSHPLRIAVGLSCDPSMQAIMSDSLHSPISQKVIEQAANSLLPLLSSTLDASLKRNPEQAHLREKLLGAAKVGAIAAFASALDHELVDLPSLSKYALSRKLKGGT